MYQNGGPGQQVSVPHIPGLPNRPPPQLIPNLPVRPQMQGHVALCAGHVLNVILGQANANILRQYLFYEVAANNFANDYYPSLVLMVAEYADMLIHAAGYPYSEAIQKAAVEVCRIESARIATENPGLQQYLGPEAHAQLQELHALRFQIKQGIDAFKYQLGQVGAGYGHPPAQSHMPGYPGHTSHSMHHSVPINRGGFYRPVSPNANMGFSGTRGGMESMWETTQAPAGTGTGRQRSPLVEGGAQQTPASTQHSQPENITRNQSLHSNVEVEFEKEPESKMEEQLFIANEKLTGMQRTFNEYDPHPALFDPSVETACYLVKDSQVTEVIKPNDEVDVKYDEHKTEHFFKNELYSEEELIRNKAEAEKAFRSAIAEINISAAHERFSQEDLSDEERDELVKDLDKKIKVVEFTDPPIVLARDAVFSTIRDEFHAEGIDARVARGNINVEIAVVGEYQLNDTEALFIEMLRQGPDYLGVHSKLKNSKESLPLRRRINKILTDEVNEVLSVEMGLKTTIDSFLVDITELLPYLGRKYGARIRDAFEASYDDVMKSICIIGETEGELRVVGEYRSINMLNMESIDFVANMVGNHAYVSEDKMPHLYKAVKAALDRADASHRAIRRAEFMTKDGQAIRLHRSRLGDKLLVSRVD